MTLGFLALATLAVANPECPAGTLTTELPQGNTLILSCLDAQGRPHGPFEVRAFADSSRSGTGVRIIEGRFNHGKQVGDWTNYDQDGRVTGRTRFIDGIEVEGSRELE